MMRRKGSTLTALLGVLAATAAITGCGSSSASSGASNTRAGGTSSSQSAAANAGNITVGVMIKDTTIPFFAPQVEGYRLMAAKYGWKLDLRNGNADPATEVAAVQQFIADKVKMIFVTPDTPTGLIPVIKQANAAGIPVIVVNSTVASGAKFVSFVGASDVQYGQALGHALIGALGPGGGTVAIIRGKPGDSPDALRDQGFTSVIAKVHNIHVVGEQAANWENSMALSVTQNFLSKYPAGRLSAIVDFGPEGVSGAQYAQRIGRQVKFIVGDYPVQVRQAILSGAIYAAVDQDPERQSITAMQLARQYLTGDKASIPKIDYLKLPVVTKATAPKIPAKWNN
jgi:ABC-type sugar transport system substrate-binding protein